ncbi:histidine kinase, partial [Flavihumibacter sediminis]|nr:histidine kinase [Flavihumibacter sediminis]
IHTTYEQALQLERINKDKLENELQLLKAQFHPHFLFNALNTLYFQIEEQNTSARFTLEKLSDLLRYQLYDQDAKVPLERELAHLKNFIDLQQQRANSQLDLVINWPSSTHQAQLYPLLLLP